MTKIKTSDIVRELGLSKEDILNDYRIACESRETSLLGRREVLTGKAKFGIFGDGKELPQIALSHFYQPGDIRAGYYRDQTVIFAKGMGTIENFFAQLYADPSIERDPFSAGRQMNAHFATHFLDENGEWKVLTEAPQSSADLSPTASQMAKMTGLAQASKLYRNLDKLPEYANKFSKNGNEIIFGSIGDASTSEGIFWETVNAVSVLQVPLVLSVWDDGYGISVPKKYQTAKESISQVLSGLQSETPEDTGMYIFKVKAWDYPALLETYKKATELVRKNHKPALIHVEEVTQPQGHSTSGSHERYKSKERLEWEKEFDGIKKFKEWILENGFASAEELEAIEKDAKKTVRDAKNRAWKAYIGEIKKELKEAVELYKNLLPKASRKKEVQEVIKHLLSLREPTRKDISESITRMQILTRELPQEDIKPLAAWKEKYYNLNKERWDSHLYSQSAYSYKNIEEVPPVYTNKDEYIPGFQVLNRYFDNLFATHPEVLAFGEDVGYLGDVNQAFAGLQAKYGELRISDTGIREATIVGQAIGLALRGFRPIAEIQYLDYLLYALQIMSDDIATMLYRTKGRQKLPLIIRTRGHRLEGIWHSGSPMGGLLHLLRGMLVLVPRNMVQAVGLYNAVMKTDEPALMIEVLNGYRLRERVPQNLYEFTLPIGMPEIVKEGTDITLVTYGPNVRIASEAIAVLEKEFGISVELIDVRTLLPFDTRGIIAESLEKTNRIVFLDEDVPGGATAYMMQEVLEKQGGYFLLDSPPVTITGKPHRPAYGTDGDYFSKPNKEQIIETLYNIMHEAEPRKFPELF